MTDREADEAMQARWAHPPVAPADVEERVALRYRDRDMKPGNIQVHSASSACRVFLRLAETGGRRGTPGSAATGALWRSYCVHSTTEVDGVIDALEHAFAQLGEQERAA